MIQSGLILDILNLILDGEDVDEEAKMQIETLTESDFNYTGSGLFVSFTHDEQSHKFRLSEESLVLNGVEIKSPDLAIGADATIFFKDGLIDHLEIWSHDGVYPEKELTEYSLKRTWS
jgi:hypothetical protein